MTARGLDRRTLIASGAAWLAAPALRAAAEPASPATAAAILAASGLGELTGFALADLGGSGLLEAHQPDLGRPPASVAKIVTTLYALEALGPDYRFATRILGAGAIEGGVLRGDLVLAGGGDPRLDTDALGALAAALGTRGLTGVSGRLLVADGALPAVAEIDPGQPAEAAYNATVSGINLNFNRVFMAWQAGATGLAFSAPGARFEAAVSSIRAELVEDGPPKHRDDGGSEIWSLPRDGLRRRGSVWLPVRAPGPYAGEVFGRLAEAQGLALPAAEAVAAAQGAELALHGSPPLARVLREMLAYSTNLTAEAVGLRAGQARGVAPDGLAASGAAMTAWARARFGLTRTNLVNHSGLSGESRLSAADLVTVLRQAEAAGLPALLKPRPILDAGRRPFAIPGVAVVSKTGTMDFVSGLAGYLSGPRRRLAFAILVADPARRAAIRPEEREKPPGGAAWLARARAQEQALLRRWAAVYAA